MEVEYKQRQLKIRIELSVMVTNVKEGSPDFSTTQFLQAKLEKLCTDYLSNKNVIQIIDMQRNRIQN